MNPYDVLGVSENATEDEIKTAYRKLVKKYHPDRFANDPEKQAAASEKLKQINAAYDMITKMKQGGYSASGSGSPLYAQVRMAIQRNDLVNAEAMLNRMSEHPAEWHYLMGVILFRRGWFDGAAEHFNMAYRMEPGNEEYAQAVRSMSQMSGMYMDFGGRDEEGGGSTNKNCLICATCACLGCSMAGMFRCLPCFCCI
ncbi:MAG: DnaJ domain-containing protein [Christensenella sp.]|nr:DnaJ domain-containing protein [Christensenella sp.]